MRAAASDGDAALRNEGRTETDAALSSLHSPPRHWFPSPQLRPSHRTTPPLSLPLDGDQENEEVHTSERFGEVRVQVGLERDETNAEKHHRAEGPPRRHRRTNVSMKGKKVGLLRFVGGGAAACAAAPVKESREVPTAGCSGSSSSTNSVADHPMDHHPVSDGLLLTPAACNTSLPSPLSQQTWWRKKKDFIQLGRPNGAPMQAEPPPSITMMMGTDGVGGGSADGLGGVPRVLRRLFRGGAGGRRSGQRRTQRYIFTTVAGIVLVCVVLITMGLLWMALDSRFQRGERPPHHTAAALLGGRPLPEEIHNAPSKIPTGEEMRNTRTPPTSTSSSSSSSALPPSLERTTGDLGGGHPPSPHHDTGEPPTTRGTGEAPPFYLPPPPPPPAAALSESGRISAILSLTTPEMTLSEALDLLLQYQVPLCSPAPAAYRPDTTKEKRKKKKKEEAAREDELPNITNTGAEAMEEEEEEEEEGNHTSYVFPVHPVLVSPTPLIRRQSTNTTTTTTPPRHGSGAEAKAAAGPPPPHHASLPLPPHRVVREGWFTTQMDLPPAPHHLAPTRGHPHPTSTPTPGLRDDSASSSSSSPPPPPPPPPPQNVVQPTIRIPRVATILWRWQEIEPTRLPTRSGAGTTPPRWPLRRSAVADVEEEDRAAFSALGAADSTTLSSSAPSTRGRTRWSQEKALWDYYRSHLQPSTALLSTPTTSPTPGATSGPGDDDDDDDFLLRSYQCYDRLITLLYPVIPGDGMPGEGAGEEPPEAAAWSDWKERTTSRWAVETGALRLEHMLEAALMTTSGRRGEFILTLSSAVRPSAAPYTDMHTTSPASSQVEEKEERMKERDKMGAGREQGPAPEPHPPLYSPTREELDVPSERRHPPTAFMTALLDALLFPPPSASTGATRHTKAQPGEVGEREREADANEKRTSVSSFASIIPPSSVRPPSPPLEIAAVQCTLLMPPKRGYETPQPADPQAPPETHSAATEDSSSSSSSLPGGPSSSSSSTGLVEDGRGSTVRSRGIHRQSSLPARGSAVSFRIASARPDRHAHLHPTQQPREESLVPDAVDALPPWLYFPAAAAPNRSSSSPVSYFHHLIPTPSQLRGYTVLDHGGFIGATSDGTMLLPFLSRRHAGRTAADQRTLWPEMIDAVSSHCGLWRRRAIQVSGCPLPCNRQLDNTDAEDAESKKSRRVGGNTPPHSTTADPPFLSAPLVDGRAGSATPHVGQGGGTRQENKALVIESQHSATDKKQQQQFQSFYSGDTEARAISRNFMEGAPDSVGWRLSFAIHMASGYSRSFGHHDHYDHPLVPSLDFVVYRFSASRAVGIWATGGYDERHRYHRSLHRVRGTVAAAKERRQESQKFAPVRRVRRRLEGGREVVQRLNGRPTPQSTASTLPPLPWRELSWFNNLSTFFLFPLHSSTASPAASYAPLSLRPQPLVALTDTQGRALGPLLMRLLMRRVGVSWRDRWRVRDPEEVGIMPGLYPPTSHSSRHHATKNKEGDRPPREGKEHELNDPSSPVPETDSPQARRHRRRLIRLDQRAALPSTRRQLQPVSYGFREAYQGVELASSAQPSSVSYLLPPSLALGATAPPMVVYHADYGGSCTGLGREATGYISALQERHVVFMADRDRAPCPRRGNHPGEVAYSKRLRSFFFGLSRGARPVPATTAEAPGGHVEVDYWRRALASHPMVYLLHMRASGFPRFYEEVRENERRRREQQQAEATSAITAMNKEELEEQQQQQMEAVEAVSDLHFVVGRALSEFSDVNPDWQPGLTGEEVEEKVPSPGRGSEKETDAHLIEISQDGLPVPVETVRKVKRRVVDEFWVTADFFAHVYRRRGVPPHQLRWMPLSVDTYTYDPHAGLGRHRRSQEGLYWFHKARDYYASLTVEVRPHSTPSSLPEGLPEPTTTTAAPPQGSDASGSASSGGSSSTSLPISKPPSVAPRVDAAALADRTIFDNKPNMSVAERKNRFVFLSTFKWEDRKGWNILLEAYYIAFTDGTSNVSLQSKHRQTTHGDYQFVKLKEGEEEEADAGDATLTEEHKKKEGPDAAPVALTTLILKTSFEDPYAKGVQMSNIASFLNEWLQGHPTLGPEVGGSGGVHSPHFPHLVITNSKLSDDSLVELYGLSDAFVLPTRGEGWGLPLAEAMSMAVPVIAPYYSGVEGFLTFSNAFIIPLDGLNEVPWTAQYGYFRGTKWSVPCARGTAMLMRYVVEHPEHARIVGERGRAWMLRYFSEEAVADRMDAALVEGLLKAKESSASGRTEHEEREDG